jgi:hypothetical protein
VRGVANPGGVRGSAQKWGARRSGVPEEPEVGCRLRTTSAISHFADAIWLRQNGACSELWNIGGVK